MAGIPKIQPCWKHHFTVAFQASSTKEGKGRKGNISAKNLQPSFTTLAWVS